MQLELDDILARVNQMLLKDLEHGHFVTLFLARLNPDHRRMSYASAGHVPSFVFLESGEVKCTPRQHWPTARPVFWKQVCAAARNSSRQGSDRAVPHRRSYRIDQA
jgi:hypothetical protein